MSQINVAILSSKGNLSNFHWNGSMKSFQPSWTIQVPKSTKTIGSYAGHGHEYRHSLIYTITLMTLLRILFFGRIGSTKLVLPIWQNINILNRDNRVMWGHIKKKRQKQKMHKSRLLCSTKGEENKIEL
jgi:hypothetical protein